MFVVVRFKCMSLGKMELPGMYEPDIEGYFTTNDWEHAMQLLDEACAYPYKGELWTFDSTYHQWYRVRFQFNDRDTKEFIQ